jgi:hypothetical protein
MMESNMQEAKHSRTIINDIEPRALKELIRFSYTGQVIKNS